MSILVGTVVAYGAVVDGGSPPPDGWMLCDGRALSRQQYAELFAVIGTLHGGGDGVTTFNLPDYRGRFHRGQDEGTGNDPDANKRDGALIGGLPGDRVGTVQRDATAVPTGPGNAFVLAETGKHRHDVRHLPVDKSWYEIAGTYYAEWTDDATDSSTSGKHSHTVTGGGDWETVPKSIYVHYLIACGDVAP